MISRQRLSIQTAISVLLFSFLFIGTACASKVGDDDIADWLIYFNAESGFTFNYPADWEVVDDGFYKTAYVATLQKIGGSEDSNNWIRINSPQFMEEDGKCLEADNQRICTYSKDTDVLNIFEKVAASFKLNRTQQDRTETETTGTENH